MTGKNVPVKAVVFTLLDEVHEPVAKYEALQSEIRRRYFKNLLVQSLHMQGTPPLLDKHQVLTKQFFKSLVTELANDSSLIEDVPVPELDAAELLVKVANGNNPDDVIEYLSSKKHFSGTF